MSDGNAEKETLVVVDFVDSPENFLEEVKEEVVKFLNLDSADPAVQIGHLLFKGNYINSLDTNIIFEVPQPTPESETSGSDNGSMPKEYIGKTAKVLEAKRAVLDKGDSAT